MAEPFALRVDARAYDVDSNGHVAGVALLQYSQHARWEYLRAAGVDHARLAALEVGPVSLEERIRFAREVLPGDELTITCEFEWGEGKTFRLRQRLLDLDRAQRADVTNVGGLLDLRRRRLVPDPGGYWRKVSARPELLGL